MKKLLWALLITGLIPVISYAETNTGAVITKDAQGIDFTQSIDVGSYDRFSLQAIYSSASLSASSFTDGAYSSATLTVADYASLDGRPSTATITLVDGNNTSVIDNAVVTINGKTYTEGIDWDRLATSTMTMESLASALNAHSEYDAVSSSNVIYATASLNGTYANSWTISSSTPAAISTAGFSGGQEHGYFRIGDVTLTEGTNWNAETSSAVTAVNIQDAINDNATLVAITSSAVQASGIVRVRSLYPAIAQYPLSVSNTSYLTPSQNYLSNGSATDVSVPNDTITENAHGFSTGLSVLYATVSGTAPTGLTTGTTYYVIRDDANTYRLATSAVNASAGTDIDITALTGAGSFTVTPLAFAAGSAGFKWQGSNDNSNFSDLAVSSITYSSPDNQLWDMGEYNYRYIRVNFTGPTTGGIDLDVIMNGRR